MLKLCFGDPVHVQDVNILRTGEKISLVLYYNIARAWRMLAAQLFSWQNCSIVYIRVKNPFIFYKLNRLWSVYALH